MKESIMGLFRQLQNNPRYCQAHSSSSVTVKIETPYFAQVDLEFDRHDHLASFCYSVKKDCFDLPIFEALAHLVIGGSIEQVEIIGFGELDQFFGKDKDYLSYRDDGDRSLVNIPLQVFYRALASYKGQDMPRQESSPLVCRCFGVFEREIVNYIEKQEQVDLKKINGELLAGAGCTRCSEDIQKYLKRFELQRGLKSSGLGGRALQVMEIYQAFCQWRPSSQVDIDITDFTSDTLKVVGRGMGFSHEDLKAFKQWLYVNYRLQLVVEDAR